MTDNEYSQALNDFEELHNEENANHAEKPEAVDILIYEDEDVVVKTEYEEPLKKEVQELEEEAELEREEEEELERELEEELKREEEEEDEEPDINPQMFLSIEEDLLKACEENEAIPLPNLRVLPF